MQVEANRLDLSTYVGGHQDYQRKDEDKQRLEQMNQKECDAQRNEANEEMNE